jgi:hypothetical protein
MKSHIVVPNSSKPVDYGTSTGSSRVNDIEMRTDWQIRALFRVQEVHRHNCQSMRREIIADPRNLDVQDILFVVMIY